MKEAIVLTEERERLRIQVRSLSQFDLSVFSQSPAENLFLDCAAQSLSEGSVDYSTQGLICLEDFLLQIQLDRTEACCFLHRLFSALATGLKNQPVVLDGRAIFLSPRADQVFLVRAPLILEAWMKRQKELDVLFSSLLWSLQCDSLEIYGLLWKGVRQSMSALDFAAAIRELYQSCRRRRWFGSSNEVPPYIARKPVFNARTASLSSRPALEAEKQHQKKNSGCLQGQKGHLLSERAGSSMSGPEEVAFERVEACLPKADSHQSEGSSRPCEKNGQLFGHDRQAHFAPWDEDLQKAGQEKVQKSAGLSGMDLFALLNRPALQKAEAFDGKSSTCSRFGENSGPVRKEEADLLAKQDDTSLQIPAPVWETFPAAAACLFEEADPLEENSPLAGCKKAKEPNESAPRSRIRNQEREAAPRPNRQDDQQAVSSVPGSAASFDSPLFPFQSPALQNQPSEKNGDDQPAVNSTFTEAVRFAKSETVVLSSLLSQVFLEVDGAAFALEQTDVLVGRSAECGVCLHDPSVSTRHARLLCQEGRWYVQDLHSTNGTWIGSKKVIRRMRLKEGMVIRFGNRTAIFREQPVCGS